MLHECRATHVLWVIWDENLMVAFIFKFDLRKCQCEVKLRRKCQISKLRIFLQKKKHIPVLSSFVSGLKKMLLIFTYDDLKCQKWIRFTSQTIEIKRTSPTNFSWKISWSIKNIHFLIKKVKTARSRVPSSVAGMMADTIHGATNEESGGRHLRRHWTPAKISGWLDRKMFIQAQIQEMAYDRRYNPVNILHAL